MTAFAHISSGLVTEILRAAPGFSFEDSFHPEIVAACIECGDEVRAGWIFQNGIFSAPVGPSLDDVKAARIAALSLECESAILGGFTSSALGAPHSYPCQIKDQINLSGSVISSMLDGLPEDWSTPFWCADASGAWEFRPHSAAEIRVAGADGKAHILACQSVLLELTSDVTAADTVEAVAAVGWPD